MDWRNITDVRVISLARTPSRLNKFLARFPHQWDFPMPICYSAVDGRIEGPPAPPAFQANAGAWGCLQSHMRIIREKFWRVELSPVMIFEDDCQLQPNACDTIKTALASVPDDADMLFIGGQQRILPEPVCPGIVRCRETGRTHAYIIFPKFYDLFLQMCRRCVGHIDHTLQHWMKSLDEIKCYAIDPFCAFQMEGASTVMEGEYDCHRSFDDRVDAKVRDPSAVRAAWIVGEWEDVLPMARRGEIMFGGLCGLDHYPKAMVSAAGMKDDQDQADEIMRYINRERAAAACYESAVIAVWHPGIRPSAIEIVAKTHPIDLWNHATRTPNGNDLLNSPDLK